MTDKEGYQLVEKEFNSGGYHYEFVEQLDKDWRIYAAMNPRMNNQIFDYELVRFVKHEEREVFGNKVAKKWSYPAASNFGIDGFSCRSIKTAKILHQDILSRKEELEVIEEPVNLPINEEFTVKDLVKEKGHNRFKLDLLIKSLGDKVSVVRLVKNKTGFDSKVLIYNP